MDAQVAENTTRPDRRRLPSRKVVPPPIGGLTTSDSIEDCDTAVTDRGNATRLRLKPGATDWDKEENRRSRRRRGAIHRRNLHRVP